MATVELTGYAALLFAVVSLGVQLVAWGLASYGARLAAEHALQATRVYGATPADGQAEANLMLASSVGNGLRDPQVRVTRTATTVTVVITGHAFAVIPGLAPPVSVTVSAPVERAT